MHRRFLSLGRSFCLAGLLVLGLISATAASDLPPLPDGFCDVREALPGLMVDMRYAGEDNFVGRPIQGYEEGRAVLSEPAAAALAQAQSALAEQGLQLILWDAYRPQRASDDFVSWAKDLQDQAQKDEYYPNVPKSQMFKAGYIARRSGHSRGSTVDVGLLDGAGEPLDMGGGFDLFDGLSAFDAPGLTELQRENRILLRDAMREAGFLPYNSEWWHFRLEGEPYPDTYFDFPI